MKINLNKIKKNKTTSELLEFGIINIDKSSGPTSFNVSDFVKKTLRLRKTSHFGTLDPKVTGVLPVALNRACKLTGYFLGEDKEYIGIARFHSLISLREIKEKIKEKFLGKILQTPPVKSRVKRQEREREIKSFKLLEQSQGGKDILFKTEVQGGTYIRKLIDDLGKELECGAHMLELRRIRAGIFAEGNKDYPSVNLYDFEKAVAEYHSGNDTLLRRIIIPGEIVSQLFPVIKVEKSCVAKLLCGSPIHFSDLARKLNLQNGEIICVFAEDKFIGMYKTLQQAEVFARSEFVMQEIKDSRGFSF